MLLVLGLLLEGGSVGFHELALDLEYVLSLAVDLAEQLLDLLRELYVLIRAQLLRELCSLQLDLEFLESLLRGRDLCLQGLNLGAVAGGHGRAFE